MARPVGSRNKVTANVRAVVARLERGGLLNLERCLVALQAIVDDVKQPAFARIAAARELFNRAFGLPRAHIELEHGVGKSVMALLLEIHNSAEHRRNLEDLDRRRRRLTAVIVEPERENPTREERGAEGVEPLASSSFTV